MVMKTSFFLIMILMCSSSMIGLMFFSFSKSAFLMNFCLSSISEMLMSVYLMVDSLSMSFMCMVSMISGLVMFYSNSYMQNELMKTKFNLTMILFIFSMYLMSTSSSIFWLMIGWDGLGITSFCLIMFFQNWKSFNSAMTTFMCNRIGDLFLISSIFSLSSLGSMSSWTLISSLTLSMLISILAFSKSAQIPFSYWLPLAMAAPTPVSSLVHSSTLITAGVFVLIRFSSIIHFKMLVTVISFMTVLMASLSAMFEYDIKKIIALSTLSHIGLMMLLISLNNIDSALIHLIMHAMFKSSLFMTMGVLIHNNGNNQDIRMLFSPMNGNPKLWMITMINSLSMMGFTFLSGFYSKDSMILCTPEIVHQSFGLNCMLLCAMLSSMYTVRMIYYLVMMKPKSCSINSETWEVLKVEKPLTIGTVLSIMAGSWFMWMLLPKEVYMDMSAISSDSKFFLIILMVIGSMLGVNSFYLKPSNLKVLSLSHMNMWFVSSLTLISVNPSFKFSQTVMNSIDNKGWILFMIKIFEKEMSNAKIFLLSLNLFNQPLKLIVCFSLILGIMITYF